MKNKLQEFINTIISERDDSEYKIVLTDLPANMILRDDLQFSSLELASLTVMLEDEFEIDVFEDGIVSTIGEILQKLNK